MTLNLPRLRDDLRELEGADRIRQHDPIACIWCGTALLVCHARRADDDSWRWCCADCCHTYAEHAESERALPRAEGEKGE